MQNNIIRIETAEQIERCFEAFKALRLHVEKSSFVKQVIRQQEQGYRIVAIDSNGIIPSAAGYRFAEFLAWGKVLYIDDLTTLPDHRGNGYAGQLMDFLIAEARERDCDQLHLDTGYVRHDAHKLYLKKGLKFVSHHASLILEK